MSIRPKFCLWLTAVAIVASLTTNQPLSATNGALEISQACVASGCFPGDPPGFPVLITQQGSYVLTSNLQVPDENTSAIDVDAHDVTLDLGGFAILGITDCGLNTGTPCSPTGGGTGVSGSSGDRLSVRNGSVRGMGSFGVTGGALSTIENVRVSSNGLDGISAQSGVILNSQAQRNGRHGINVSGSSVISGNVVLRNNEDGIDCGGRCTLEGNTVSLSGQVGIRAFVASTVIGNTINNNFGVGLQASPSVAYGNNSLFGNGDSLPASQVGGGPTQVGQNVCATGLCP